VATSGHRYHQIGEYFQLFRLVDDFRLNTTGCEEEIDDRRRPIVVSEPYRRETTCRFVLDCGAWPIPPHDQLTDDGLGLRVIFH